MIQRLFNLNQPLLHFSCFCISLGHERYTSKHMEETTLKTTWMRSVLFPWALCKRAHKAAIHHKEREEHQVTFWQAPDQLFMDRIIPLMQGHFSGYYIKRMYCLIDKCFQPFKHLARIRKSLMDWMQLQRAPVLRDTGTHLLTSRRVIATGKENRNKKKTCNTAILHLLVHHRSYFCCFLMGPFWGWRKKHVCALPASHSSVPGSFLALFKHPFKSSR